MYDVKIKLGELTCNVYEGTGDNLLPEDVEEGYVDYLLFEIYDNKGEEIDSGQYLYTELIQDTCKTEDEFIKMFLKDHDLEGEPYEILREEEPQRCRMR